MSQCMRSWDPTRPVHYEGVSLDNRYPDTTDVRSTMYYPAAKAEDILKEFQDKPYIQAEYSHAMGNSCGGLEAYKRLEAIYPHYQGGFIWDLIDQQLYQEGRLYYGGDFGDLPNSGDFCADGLLFADRTASPKLSAVKAIYSPFSLKVQGCTILLQNDSLFTDTSALQLECCWLCNGREFARFTLPCICPAGQSVTIPLSLPTLPESGEIVVQALLSLCTDTNWANAGHLISSTQSVVRSRAAVESGWKLCDGSEYLGFHCNSLQLCFSKVDGTLRSLKIHGTEWLDSPFYPTFWRAPVSNDVASHWHYEKAAWKVASLYRKLISFSLEEKGSRYEVTSTWELPTSPTIQCSMRFRFEPDEQFTVDVDAQAVPSLPNPFCFGLEGAAKDFAHNLQYYGLGPLETTADRTAGALLGQWQVDAFSALTPYMKPQSCGLRTDVRWLSCGGLRIEGDVPFCFSALPCTSHQLEGAAHPWELPTPQHTVLRLLAWECGVGGDDTWGSRPLPEWRMENAPLHLSVKSIAENTNFENFSQP